MAHLLDLPALQPGDRVQDPLLVRDVEERPYAGGRFTILTLGNATGTIESAPVWDSDRALIDGIRKRHVVQVIGQVGLYNGRRQLEIVSLRLLPEGGADLAQLLPSVGDPAPYWEKLDGWRREIRKPRLAAVLGLFYDDDDFRHRYERCPASVSGHHAALGGLLKHTVEVGFIGRAIAKVAGADGDLLLAGVLLHDVGKLESYRWDGLFEHTDAGHLLGHVVLSALMLDRRLAAAHPPPCTPDERAVLLHLVLSHHGRLEFGSPVLPLTLEAEVLHWADNASAKTASMADALRDPDAFAADALVAQRRVWQLENRRPYRGVSDWGEGGTGSDG
jgi:3'-5' exoribonuclease